MWRSSTRWPSISAVYLETLDGPPVSCLTLLQVGFTKPDPSPDSLVRSYRTVSPLPVPRRAIGGLFSVALSCGSPRLAVSEHPALWSPDLPRHRRLRTDDAATRPTRRTHLRTRVDPVCTSTWHAGKLGKFGPYR